MAAGDRGGHRRRDAGSRRPGLVDLGKSIYTAPRVAWLSHLVGGFLFGFGMTLASGCGSKTLIRLGAGNLKSLVVLIVLGDLRVHDAEGAVRRVARERARSAAPRYERVRRRSIPICRAW